MVYFVDATVASGLGPIRIRPAQADGAEVGRCGALYNAPFDVGPGEVAGFEDASIAVQVLATDGSAYRVRITRK